MKAHGRSLPMREKTLRVLSPTSGKRSWNTRVLPLEVKMCSYPPEADLVKVMAVIFFVICEW